MRHVSVIADNYSLTTSHHFCDLVIFASQSCNSELKLRVATRVAIQLQTQNCNSECLAVCRRTYTGQDSFERNHHTLRVWPQPGEGFVTLFLCQRSGRGGSLEDPEDESDGPTATTMASSMHCNWLCRG